jgi:hypothetical protein
MSDTVLHDTNLDFSVSIISIDRKGDVTTTPIDGGVITYLEVRDDLVNFGLTGSLSYNNIFQIVDRLGVTRDSDKTLYILCNIKDRDLGRPEDTISFLGLLEKSATDGGNIIDINQTFLFEEAITSRLKKTSVLHFLPRSSGRIPELISSILDITNTPYDSSSFNVDSTTSTSLTPFLEVNDSAYKVITNLYNSLMLRNISSLSIPLIKVEGDQVENRRLVLRDFLTTRHINFIKAYIDKSNDDFSDVYLEEFTISPDDSDSINSSIHNKVEEYNIIKPDISNLRQTIWGSYRLDTISDEADPTLSTTDLVYYERFVSELETYLGGVPSNLPKIDRDNQKVFQINSKTDLNSGSIALDTAYNRVWKSFILRNETIVLKVKGKVYRKPGRFISLKGVLADKKLPQTELWLVVDVKHKFIKGNYINEITATRVMGNEFLAELDSFGSGSTSGVFTGDSGTTRGIFRPTGKRNIGESEIRENIKRALQGSSLIRQIPRDGSRYGITTGSAEEWEEFFVRVAKYESSFNTNTRNDADPGGSLGLFQISVYDGSRYGANPIGRNWTEQEAFDPYNNTVTAVKIFEKQVPRTNTITNNRGQGAAPGLDKGGYFAATTMTKIRNEVTQLNK